MKMKKFEIFTLFLFPLLCFSADLLNPQVDISNSNNVITILDNENINSNINDRRHSNGNSILIDKWLITGRILNDKLELVSYDTTLSFSQVGIHTDANSVMKSVYEDLVNYSSIEFSHTWTFIKISGTTGEIFYPLIKQEGLDYYVVSRFIKFNILSGAFETSNFDSFNYMYLISKERIYATPESNISNQIQIPFKCSTIIKNNSSNPIVAVSIRAIYSTNQNPLYNYNDLVHTFFSIDISNNTINNSSGYLTPLVQDSKAYEFQFLITYYFLRGKIIDLFNGSTILALKDGFLVVYCFDTEMYHKKYNFNSNSFGVLNDVSISSSINFHSIKNDISFWSNESYLISCALIYNTPDPNNQNSRTLIILVTKISDNSKQYLQFWSSFTINSHINYCKSVGQWIFICIEGSNNYCFSYFLKNSDPMTIYDPQLCSSRELIPMLFGMLQKFFS